MGQGPESLSLAGERIWNENKLLRACLLLAREFGMKMNALTPCMSIARERME
jgi:hypothetical protein